MSEFIYYRGEGNYAALLTEFVGLDKSRDFIGFLVSLTEDEVVGILELFRIPMNISNEFIMLMDTREAFELVSLMRVIQEETEYLKDSRSLSEMILKVYLTAVIVREHKKGSIRIVKNKEDNKWYLAEKPGSTRIRITPRHDSLE